ncbi:MAG: DNA translocase FtsK [Clostridia bacterium]|nr:DNA translocase FtsK [Clostridia bacterium]
MKMASAIKKNTNKKASANNTRGNGNKTKQRSTSGAAKEPKLTKAEQRRLDERKQTLKAEVTAIAFIGISVIIFICVIASDRMGIAGGYVSAGLKHLFGIGAVIMPVVFMVFGVQTLMDKTKYAYKFKLTLFIGFFLTIICLAHVFSMESGIGDVPFSQYISNSFLNGGVGNGGLIGALIGGVLCALIGKTGTAIILIILGIILIVLATGKTVADFLGAFGDWIDGTKEEFQEYRRNHIVIDEEEEYDSYYDEEENVQMELPVEKMKKNKRQKDVGRKPVYIDIPEEKGINEEKVIIDTDLFKPKRIENMEDDEQPPADIPSFIKDDMEAYEKSLKINSSDNDFEYEDDYSEPEIPVLNFAKKEEIKREELEKKERNEEVEFESGFEEVKEDKTEIKVEEAAAEEKKEYIVKDSSEDVPPWEESAGQPEIIEAEETKEINKLDIKTNTPYKFPSASLLSKNPNKSGATNRDELIRKSKLLEETLSTFGVNAKVVNVSQGPAVTRYELIPPKGIPVSKITKLDKDIELGLAAKSVRIEAPIPGTNKIGIELGNDSVSPVYFSEVLLTDKFRDYKSKLAFGVGKDITGTVIVTDIADMTHLLIAGATGAGKSVCINTLITSILYKATPDEVKLIMIDPKKVELSVYNGIPHLLIPVVSDVQKASGALNWAIREMERRYDLLEKYGVRNIKGYNKLKDVEKLPYIVIIIDELADLMMTTGKEVENAIVRITQLARAAGMHLVIATQRPDSNIVTGLIKANVPSRIAFKVAGSINSKIILDATGAEKLLGRGDMLLKTRAFDDKPLRIQGAFVTDEEVEAIVESIKTDGDHYDKSVIDEINKSVAEAHGEESEGGDAGGDDLIDEVIKLVAIQQKASTSFIQRKFKIGYNRAARIIDELEERGIVGPDMGGTKGREVKIDKYQYNEWKNRQDSYDE